jgi:hypothetical protein
MPEAVVTPAPAAATPAAPATASPTTSATTAPATSAPATETTSTTTNAAPDTTSAETSTAASSTTATGSPEPKREDFEDPEEFLKAHYKWEAEQEGGETEVDEATAATGEEQQTGEQQTGDEAQVTNLSEEVESLTPESLTTLIESSPALKEAIEQDPKTKGALYQMARENAKLKPIGELFPTVESAKFAHETAGRFTGIRSAFMLAAEDPAKISDAFDMFLDEFKVVGNDGKPVLDEAGNQLIAEDFNVLMNYAIDNYYDGELAEIEERLNANNFSSDVARENAEAFKAAVKFIRDYKNANPAEFDRPDLSSLPEDQRKYIENREAEIRKREEELGIRKQQQSKSERAQVRQQYEQKFLSSFGKEVGTRLGTYLKEKMESGVYVPSYVLETIDKQTGVSVFAKNVFDKFQQKLDSIAQVKQKAAELQMRQPSDLALQDRLNYTRSLIDAFLPGIIDSELRLVQGKERKDREARSARNSAARQTVEPEPRGGAAPRPRMMSEEDAMKEAYARVDKQYAGQYLDAAERMHRALVEKERILHR